MHSHFMRPLAIGVLLCLAFTLGILFQSFVPFAGISEAHGLAPATQLAPANPALPAGTQARLTYQGRLTGSSGAAINAPVNMTFRIYTSTPGIAIWTSALRSVTPAVGLFTVYLGDGADPNLDDGTLGQAAFIGVTVAGDAEMTPRQPLNSVAGHSDNSVGVFGSSNANAGVLGSSVYGYGISGMSNVNPGVYGESQHNAGIDGRGYSFAGVRGRSSDGSGVEGMSSDGVGVSGFSFYADGVSAYSTWADGMMGATGSSLTAGVAAQGAISSSTALVIKRGGIKAANAAIGSNTFAFIHQSSVANISSNYTRIDNLLTNGNQDAMLFVTHVNNPTTIASNSFTMTLGVYYDVGVSKWTIYREDSQPFPVGATFNVMVINR